LFFQDNQKCRRYFNALGIWRKAAGHISIPAVHIGPAEFREIELSDEHPADDERATSTPLADSGVDRCRHPSL
jgi:hypothetical protein